MSPIKEEETVSSSQPFRGKGETILLVDDEEMVLEVGGEMLETIGYKVVTAETGEKAIDIVKRGKEWHCPGDSGHDYAGYGRRGNL
jgi:response regulator RpfG family c-di-GMP phosphodiesterase